MKAPYTIKTHGVTIKQDEDISTRVLRRFNDGSLDVEVTYLKPSKTYPIYTYLHFDSELEAKEECWIN